MIQWATRCLFVCLVSLLAWPMPSAFAQVESEIGSENRPVSLIADSVDFDPASGVLIARGNVQVFRGSQVLATQEVIYDQRKKQLSIPGPLTLTDGENVVTRANSAQLDSDLRNGLIQGAELLIQQQLQLVSNRMHRQDGKFKVLDKVVATSCHICAKNPIPFWQIRSRRAIHDEEARRLYFESATLDVLGIPVFHAPNLRIPDPSVRRATGFLVPSISNSSTLGYGVEVPYYWTLGDHADLTLTTRVFSKGSFLLNPQYRREVKRGRFEIDGHFTLSDSLTANNTRSSLSANGLFQLEREIELEFGVEVASDDDFRDDYGIGVDGENRLTSFITLRRTRKNSFASLSASYIQSLRAIEIDQEIPLVLPEFYGRKTWIDPIVGGKFGITAQSVTLLREGDSEFTRFGVITDWEKEWILRNGLIVGAYGGVSANSYYTQNIGGAADGTLSEVVPTAAVDLRWPLSRQNGRVTHVIEPRIQVIWSPDDARRNANEDSVQVEFEETNLFSINRFPGFDATERGLRANVGITYTRYDPEGWTYGLTLGRVLRDADLNQFGAGTGLTGTESDYVSAINLSFNDKFNFVNRTLFDDDFTVGKNEMQLDMDFNRVSAQASYVWLEQDVVAGASDRTHEAALSVQYQYDDYWSFSGAWRQNLETGNSTSGAFGVRYENECVAVNLSYSLQFEGSGIVRRTRELGLTVELAGLGNKKRNKKYAHRCAGLNG
ncbi:LPS assembly protein LptD [Amylibacter sp. IMCC11727]|uniref:LPS-assembly protein LptD n=1 Tax=Amylibacter sp. IMCC11727 TaxID=3039851 RepID=UPI00244E41EE|nr:LPS assembly protein LptD [Amylibacter sp. IMCC11727]WGI20763.1 LPS assembly protein LptD [Amylibacter sp. IMCC11727]